MNINRFAYDLLDGHARIERAVGVLEDHLEFSAAATKFPSGQAGDRFTVKIDLPGGGFNEANDGPTESGFATAALADESDRLACRYGQAYVINRFDICPDPAEQTVLHREMDLEILNFEQIHARGSERGYSGSGLPQEQAAEHSSKNNAPNDSAALPQVQAVFVGSHGALLGSADESGSQKGTRSDS